MPDQRDNEKARLAALSGYGLLDTPNEPEFDAIVRQAQHLFSARTALISLIDEHRQWFMAKVGIDPAETPRSISFCTHAIRRDEIFVVTDATKDERFADSPLVTGEPHIRFYAGMPLRTPAGHRIGTLCVFDDKVRPEPTEAEREGLAALADRTMEAFERRRVRLANRRASA